MINWKVRIKNKAFWIAIIPALLILVQTVSSLFGFDIDITEIEVKLLGVVNSVFIILSIIGIVNDPTTAGYSDSQQAMKYEEPREEENKDPEFEEFESKNTTQGPF